MIGRAAIGYPWIFDEIKHYRTTGELLAPPTIDDRVTTCKKHLHHAMQWKGPKLGILEMRPHYGNYLRGLSHIKDFRMQLVHAENIEQLDEIFYQIVEHYSIEANL
jgi:tRNA-dihydrouridine synthase B